MKQDISAFRHAFHVHHARCILQMPLNTAFLTAMIKRDAALRCDCPV